MTKKLDKWDKKAGQLIRTWYLQVLKNARKGIIGNLLPSIIARALRAAFNKGVKAERNIWMVEVLKRPVKRKDQR